MATTSYLQIVREIAEKLESVSNIHNIHEYFRFGSDQRSLLDFLTFQDDDNKMKVAGWLITRTSVTEHNRGAWFRHHKFMLYGYIGLKDNEMTELSFQQMIDKISTEFRNADSAYDDIRYLNGDDSSFSCIQVPDIGHRMLMNKVLCHFCQINLSITQRIVQ